MLLFQTWLIVALGSCGFGVDSFLDIESSVFSDPIKTYQ